MGLCLRQGCFTQELIPALICTNFIGLALSLQSQMGRNQRVHSLWGAGGSQWWLKKNLIVFSGIATPKLPMPLKIASH